MISVVIPSYRRKPSTALDGLLDDLSGQAASDDFEVLVVANPPDRGLKSRMRHLGPRFHYSEIEGVGANAARNRGIDDSRGELLVFLDDDCRVQDRDFLEKHASAHRAFPDALAVGGVYENPPRLGRLADAYARTQSEWLRSARRSRNEAFWLLGGNCSFKRGPLGAERFDEALVYGGTETELFLRLGARGHRFVFLEDLKVLHRPLSSPVGFARKAFFQGMGSAYLHLRGIAPKYVSAGGQAVCDAGIAHRVYLVFFKAGARSFDRRGVARASSFRIACEGILEFGRESVRVCNVLASKAFHCLRAALKG